MTINPCPDLEKLRLLLSGAILGPEAELLEQHLLECDQCVRAAQAIPTNDELVAAMKGRREFSEDTGLLNQAIERAKQLRAEAETVESVDTMMTGQRGAAADNAPSLGKRFDLEAEIDFLAPPEAANEIGRMGDYRVFEVLGIGGMGVVFRAEDPKLQRQVALKVMKPAVATSRSAKDRFVREAQATAAIDHDNIVHIYQVGEDRHVPFIAMQFLRGESLQKRLDRDGRLEQREVVRIGREVAAGLAAAHERGLIHRDIKPDNIWLDAASANRAKILDFGLVRTATDDAGLTQSGMVLGTPKYMAPEQAQGGTVDHRCDLFSLGSVLYHVASGQAPFVGGNVTAMLQAVSRADCRPIAEICPDLHPELAAMIARLLSKDPEARPQTASEVADQLSQIARRLDEERSKQTIQSHPKQLTETAELTRSSVRASASIGKQYTPRRAPVLIGGLAAAMALFAWLYLAGLIFKVETKDGTLTVKVTGDDIGTSVEGQKVTIQNRETDETYTILLDSREQSTLLKPGSYYILESASGLHAPTDHFTIRSGQTQIVEVTWVPRVRPDEPDAMHAKAQPRAVVEQHVQGKSMTEPATTAADALVAGLTPIYVNEFDEVNINLFNANSGILREIRNGRHYLICPKEHPRRGRWGWPLSTVRDGIIDVSARVEPGSDAAWLVIFHSNENGHGVTFNVNETRVSIHATIFDPGKGPNPREIPVPEPLVPGNFHRLQVLLEGDRQQVTPYFDGKLLCPPLKLDADITPSTFSLGIAHSQRDQAGQVAFERYAIYPLRPDETDLTLPSPTTQ